MQIYSVSRAGDCTHSVHLGHGDKIKCYTAAQMRAKYPHGGFNVVAETSAGAGKRKNPVANLDLGRRMHALLEVGTYGKLYKRAGFAPVEGGYVAVLQGRTGIVWWLLMVCALVAALFLFASRVPDAQGENIFNPIPQADEYATYMSQGDGESDAIYDTSGGSVSLNYSLDATLNLSSGHISMQLENPYKSNQHIVASLYVIDADDASRQTMIAKSGLIERGSALDTMVFDPTSAKLFPGAYNARFVISFYDAQTGALSTVESSIEDVTLYVSA